MSRKGSKSFAITLNNVEWSKSLTGWWLSQGDFFTEICVAEERYHHALNPETGSPSREADGVHHHVFGSGVVSYKLVDVHAILITLVDDLGFDCQPCKSRKSWLNYITKTDSHPFVKNIRVSELSFFARATHHVVTKYKYPGVVDRADDFMVSAGNFRNVAIDLAEKYMGSLRARVAARRELLPPNRLCGFARNIVESIIDGEHIYVYGPPGVGKTELIDAWCHDKVVWHCGPTDRFMFGSMPDDVQVAIFEDFHLEKIEAMLPTLLSIMDKKMVAISQKYKDDVAKVFEKVQCIFTSNYLIDDSFSMFKRRVVYYIVTHKMHECCGCEESFIY